MHQIIPSRLHTHHLTSISLYVHIYNHRPRFETNESSKVVRTFHSGLRPRTGGAPGCRGGGEGYLLLISFPTWSPKREHGNDGGDDQSNTHLPLAQPQFNSRKPQLGRQPSLPPFSQHQPNPLARSLLELYSTPLRFNQ